MRIMFEIIYVLPFHSYELIIIYLFSWPGWWLQESRSVCVESRVGIWVCVCVSSAPCAHLMTSKKLLFDLHKMKVVGSDRRRFDNRTNFAADKQATVKKKKKTKLDANENEKLTDRTVTGVQTPWIRSKLAPLRQTCIRCQILIG